MKTDTKARIWALAGTILIASLAVLLFLTVRLTAPAEPPQEVTGSIALAEDFIEVIDMDPAPVTAGDEPAAAHADQQAQAQPAPAPGAADVQGASPQLVSADSPSPQTTDSQRQQPAEVDEVANAFGNVPGKHNTASGAADQANSGIPASASEQGSATGSATGSAGGGWGIPSYAPVRSTVTGTVKLKVTIDIEGRPAKVEIIGGTPHAGTDNAVRQACVAEVKRRTFTRASSAPAPETAIAIITYSFK